MYGEQLHNRPKRPNESIQKNMLLQCRLNPLHDLRPLRYLLAFSFSTICRSSISYLLSYICTEKGIRSRCRRMLQYLGRHSQHRSAHHVRLSKHKRGCETLLRRGLTCILAGPPHSSRISCEPQRQRESCFCVGIMQQHSAGRRPTLCRGSTASSDQSASTSAADDTLCSCHEAKLNQLCSDLLNLLNLTSSRSSSLPHKSARK